MYGFSYVKLTILIQLSLYKSNLFFIEEEIDKITFLALTESMLKDLVPKFKLRAILYSKIVELKEEQCTVHLNDTNMAPNKVTYNLAVVNICTC